MKKQIRHRYCLRCDEYKPCYSKYKPICEDCKEQVGGTRGKWQKGKSSSVLRMKALGVL